MRVRVNDVRLFFDVEGSELVVENDSLQQRPTVVLLHGGPGFDHTTFKPDFSPLAEIAQLVYLDHRGNGRSDPGDPARWTLDVWADDVRAFCDALGIERPVVLGWSFGGMVAMAYAARHPDHPAKLVLQSTMARFDVDRISEGFRKVGGDEAADVARRFWSGDPAAMTAYATACLPLYSHNPPDPAALSYARLNTDLLAEPARYLRGMDLLPGLANVRCPTLVIAGDDDPVCTAADAEDIAAALPSQHVRLERLPASGHFAHRDEPGRFFAVLRGFLADAPADERS